jgi:DAK2 domain fusion protein YloV
MGQAGNARNLIKAAAALLKQRAEEVNRLNVFPVPDGDTGTNMSLTMDTVVRELSLLPDTGSLADACKAVSHGSLMGARGNSGVILSQIIRGLCEGIDAAEKIDTELLASSLERAMAVSYQAVRKPVEGTMLTVVKDVASAARDCAEQRLDMSQALERVAAEAYESVRRTPDLLPVLKENGVVDAGGFGLAILVEGFVTAALGKAIEVVDVTSESAPLMHVAPADDWDDEEYLYCTEFLLFGTDVDREALEDYVSSVGGSELVVGGDGEYKVHVHTDDPGAVLAHVTQMGEVAEVHINNMRRQTAARGDRLREEASAGAPPKPVGFVAVAAGEGLAEILKSLGVDRVVNGGQTMNPSTEDLLAAISSVHADSVVVLPNNKNIVMAANAAASVADKPVAVVPTNSVPAAFSAMIAADTSLSLDQLAQVMTEAASGVRTAEVTVAVKDATGKVGAIKAGQVIGIVDDKEIEVAGDSIDDVAFEIAQVIAEDAETLAIFAGADYTDESLAALAARIAEKLDDVEIETHRGEQPLYPVVMAAE